MRTEFGMIKDENEDPSSPIYLFFFFFRKTQFSAYYIVSWLVKKEKGYMGNRQSDVMG